MRFRFSMVVVFAFCGSAFAGDFILTDHKGRQWTDLHVVASDFGVHPHRPRLDLQTLKNAKLACMAKGAHLPQVSHLNDLADFLAREYLRSVELGVPELFDARFMRESRYFWTSTVKKEGDRFVFNRAVARLSTIMRSSDMSKADVVMKSAGDDNNKRPFLCVYIPEPATECPETH